jgi:hypothetical protein
LQPGVEGTPVAMQEQVHQPGFSEDATKLVGVTEAFVVPCRTRGNIMVNGTQPEPSPVAVLAQSLGEPVQLSRADVAVVVGLAVGVQDSVCLERNVLTM